MGIMSLKLGLFLIAYLLGSIQSGLIIGKLFFKINLNEHGSKNIGASNAFRVMGTKYGIMTLFFDAFKASLPILIAVYLLPAIVTGFDTNIILFGNSFDYSVLYGIAAILGHTYCIFLKFQGGKAVASSLGIVFTLTPIIGVIALVVYFLTVYLTKYASLGSTFAAIAVGAGTMILFWIKGNFIEQTFLMIVYGLIIAFVFIKHIPNYKNLLNKTEKKLVFGKKKLEGDSTIDSTSKSKED